METGAFALEDVSVRRGDATLLEGITCRIPASACTALVGPSGAGKTTLFRLLNRLEEPTTGTVTFQGRPLSDWNVLTLRRQVTLVGQQPDDVALLLHAVTLDSGILGWNSASYIQREVGLGGRCFVSEIRNACAGGLTAVDFAASRLFVRPDLPAAVITAADCWPATVINRWQSGVSHIAGDGGGRSYFPARTASRGFSL